MNETEEKAYSELLKEGYIAEEIICNCNFNKSPDFIIPRKNRKIEIKLARKGFVYFEKSQLYLKNNCEIWIFEDDKFHKIRLKELKRGHSKFKIRILRNYIKYKVSDKLHKTMKEVCEKIGIKESELSRQAVIEYLKTWIK